MFPNLPAALAASWGPRASGGHSLRPLSHTAIIWRIYKSWVKLRPSQPDRRDRARGRYFYASFFSTNCQRTIAAAAHASALARERPLLRRKLHDFDV